MSAPMPVDPPRRLRGLSGLVLVLVFAVCAGFAFYLYYVTPHTSRSYGHDLAFNRAMFGKALEQPIPFSHRLHVTDKEIDCYYCHPYTERSTHAGLPSVEKCMGCHDHIIPTHTEILNLRGYRDRGEHLPWVKVYYNPDHVYFPHFRHRQNGVACAECHGEVERVDRLHQVTFYMGFCLDCHQDRNAPLDCVACHQ